MTDTYSSGSRIGAHVGRQRRASGAVVVGPGGVTGPGEPQTPAQQSQYERVRTMTAEWGAEAGRLARRSARRPRLPEAEAPAYPIGPGGIVGEPVARRASRAVQVPEHYLNALTGHESGDDPEAEAPTSSATGSGQFIEETWLRMMRDYGPRYGFGEGGLANLSDEDTLDLRTDPMWSALMIGEYARENEPVLRRQLGRNVSEGEVYLGHWLGPETASVLIKASDEDARRHGRGRIARNVVGDAAFRANLPIFYTPDANITLEGEGSNRRFVYHGGGRLRTVSEVHAAQTRAFRRAPFTAGER